MVVPLLCQALFCFTTLFLLILVSIWGWTKYKLSKFKNLKDPSKWIPSSPVYSLLKTTLIDKVHYSTKLISLHDELGDIHHQWMLHFSIITVGNADLAKEILLKWKKFPKGDGLTTYFSNKFLGLNVFFINGDLWSKQRSVMNPAFYRVDKFANIFARRARDCIEMFSQMVEQRAQKVTRREACLECDIVEYIQRMTLDILGLAVFDYDYKYLECKENPQVEAYNFMISNMDSIEFLLFPPVRFLPLEKNKKLYQSSKLFDELVYSMIEKSKKKISKLVKEANSEGVEETTFLEQNSKISLIDLMVMSNLNKQNNIEDGLPYLSEKEIRDNVIIFFLGGHETTLSSMCFALYALAKQKEMQEKLYGELLRCVGPSEECVTYENVEKCEYLTWVIKETLRMYPPVGIIPLPREATSDHILGDYLIPKGSYVNVNIMSLHHDARYWKNPKEFRPERFSAEESKGRHPFCYLPFGAGPRTCIGNSFSYLEQKVFLSLFLYRFEVSLPHPDTPLKVHPTKFISHPSDDFRLIFTPRN